MYYLIYNPEGIDHSWIEGPFTSKETAKAFAVNGAKKIAEESIDYGEIPTNDLLAPCQLVSVIDDININISVEAHPEIVRKSILHSE